MPPLLAAHWAVGGRRGVRLLGKGNKPRTIRTSFATLELFESLGRTGAHATHAIRRAVDVFTFQATLVPSSSATTVHDVAAELGHSSSLQLG